MNENVIYSPLACPVPTALHQQRQTAEPSPSTRHRTSTSNQAPSFLESDTRDSFVFGVNPLSSAGLPKTSYGGSPRPPSLALERANIAQRSPQPTTPVDQTFSHPFLPESSPWPLVASPHGLPYSDLPPRSRRNSAAVVSISLSSRSRSRTPRGAAVALPGGRSGQGTPSRQSTTVTAKGDTNAYGEDVLTQMENAASHPAELDEWQPPGGMLLEGEAFGNDEVYRQSRDWSSKDIEDDGGDVEDILAPGMLFGEGLEFRDDIVEPAIGRITPDGDVALPLRRGGSEIGKPLRGSGKNREKIYEVVRRIGTGSYAVVYLVREKGGRRREYALKCLSKQDLAEEQIDTQLFEATIHLSLPIHQNIVTLHQTLQTNRWLFLMLEICPGEDLFFWLEKSRDASPPVINTSLVELRSAPMSSSKFSSSSIPFSSSQMFSNISPQHGSSFSNSPGTALSPSTHSGSPASVLLAQHNHQYHNHHFITSQTPSTPSLLSASAASTLLSSRRLRLIASMFSQMCEAVAVCHDAGISHRDIKPENFICCDSIELVTAAADGEMDFGPQAKRKVVVKLTDFGLATTEQESGDVECGSRPYMSYECRNNLGPTYLPSPADVWSLGIVLINMLFHRNPWKDPTSGDTNFDNFLRDPIVFLMAKFTGIGREVASYLANHVLCTKVENRVLARDFGNWIRNLPDMIGGKKAIHQLRIARLDNRGERGLFEKSPVESRQDKEKKPSFSALTSSAPMAHAQAISLFAAVPLDVPALSHLPSPSQLLHQASSSQLVHQASPISTPDLDMDAAETTSATTLDEQPTPADRNGTPPTDTRDPTDSATDALDSRSLSTHKRRKRGIRKGKAAQAALAAASAGDMSPTQEEREALLLELAAASQSLARDLSSRTRSPGEMDDMDFPPLGTSPAQVAAAKKSKWKDMMKLSTNPELAALAKRVAERDSSTAGNWSAPAQLQHDSNQVDRNLARPGIKQTRTQTATMSSGMSSQLSSFGPISSDASSMGCLDGDEWKLRHDDVPVRARAGGEGQAPFQRDEDTVRSRKAVDAAVAITGMKPMGSFGAYRPLATASSANRSSIPIVTKHPANTYRTPARSSAAQGSPTPSMLMVARPPASVDVPSHAPRTQKTANAPYPRDTVSTLANHSTERVMVGTSPGGAPGPNKPKLKGQMQSLAKMLSGLKTKGKE